MTNPNFRILIQMSRLLVAVVLVFTISWLPLNLINVLLDLGVDQKLGYAITFIFSTLKMTTMCQPLLPELVFLGSHLAT